MRNMMNGSFKTYEDIVKYLKDRVFECTCGCRFRLDIPLIYEHPDGLPSRDGGRYWLYYMCPCCGYQWAWWKILRRLGENAV